MKPDTSLLALLHTLKGSRRDLMSSRSLRMIRFGERARHCSTQSCSTNWHLDQPDSPLPKVARLLSIHAQPCHLLLGGTSVLLSATSCLRLHFKAQPAGSAQPSVRQTAEHACIEASRSPCTGTSLPQAAGGMKDFSRPGLTRAFLFGLPSVVTETERAMCFAGEALLGRRETGAGRPVRLRSTLPEAAPWKEEVLRVLFMLEQREGALEAQSRQRSEGTESTSSLVRQGNQALCSQLSPTKASTQRCNHFQIG